jgi:hypothetical protein
LQNKGCDIENKKFFEVLEKKEIVGVMLLWVFFQRRP